ncbi:uncharacterized protein LOC128429789 isoform X3 [Pleuronectes platessa]|nr:uncharacterized protein LOC128429789 isoform X3 [Pleuronectes platessa]
MAPPPDPPQQPQTDPVPPSQEPPSGPRKRTSKSAALPQPQPIEATVTQPEVSFEGWHKQWESGPQGLPSADVKWLKEDAERGLFKNLPIARRKILKDDRMWFHPPEIPGVVVGGGVPSADAFFRSRVFFWRPVGVWGYSLRCPRSGCPGEKAAFLYPCGYGNTVRHICDMTGWYSMLTELLACNACRKAAKGSQEHTIGRFLAWDAAILKQLTPAHQAVFPAILTPRRGVDKQVVRLMRDRTEGNTMVKVWRQVQEGHCEEYLQRKDLYTNLLCQLSRPGSIMSALGHQYQKPPTRRELPSPRLLRKAYLIYEAEHIEDYRTQIMSTFGKVLKYVSTRKICKKLSGHGRGTAEWCTNVANELGQVLMSVFTCEESLTCLKPMADGLMERYRRAGEGPPELMYVDRGCCRVHGVSSMEHLFSDWANSGMMVRLDIFHWIERFDAAVRTDHHPKYALFKSALSAAVFSYNKDDMALLIQAMRAGNTTRYASLTDAKMIEIYVSKEDLHHFVRRITLGAQESFLRVQTAINSLKGAAGLDENQVPLFKDAAAIDRVWENQQKHLECIQDPPGRDMYTVMKVVTRNSVRMPYYTTVRGSNSLEGIHFFLPRMFPGPHCAAVPFQVYLLSGIAHWNSDRESGSVKGQKGRKNRVYMSPLIDRLNKRCQDLFGEVEEINFRPPVPPGEERIGLEYLFAQSSQPFSASEHYAQTRETLQTVEDEDDEEEVAADTEESTEDDVGYATDAESDDLGPLKRNLVLTDQVVASEHDPCVEDVCGPNHLPGYQHVEELSSILVEIALEEGKLALSDSTRERVVSAWNKLDLHDRSIQQFDSLYSARWGNALFGRTNGDPAEASLVQKLKFNKRFSPAHLLDSRKNRLMYCIVKQLWLHPDCRKKARGSPLKHQITTLYQRVQQRVTVDDAELSKLGIPILKMNNKSVAEFIRRQEAFSATNVTDRGLSILQRPQSITSTSLPPAAELPDERPHTSRPQVQYEVTLSLAGTRKRKVAHDHLTSAPQPQQSIAAATATVTTAAGLQPQPQPLFVFLPLRRPALPPQLLPPPVFLPPPALPQARSTLYKRKKTELGATRPQSTVQKHTCALCGQSTQGHIKYRKKTYCQQSKLSTSKGLTGKTFVNITDFHMAVDELLASQSQAP